MHGCVPHDSRDSLHLEWGERQAGTRQQLRPARPRGGCGSDRSRGSLEVISTPRWGNRNLQTRQSGAIANKIKWTALGSRHVNKQTDVPFQALSSSTLDGQKGPSIINANVTKCPKRWLNTHRREKSHALNGWPCFPVTTSSAFLLPLSHGFSCRNHPILLCKFCCSWLPWDHGSPWWNSYADALLFDYWKVQCRPGSPSLLWRIHPRGSPILIVFEYLLPLQGCGTIGCTEWAPEAAACSAACEKQPVPELMPFAIV